ncbi:hypothetical protein NQ314_016242 [Rhamnusium bicolor]|uniref:Protein CIP2A n=1 Tax=Rhamnusium bicolor TaxID=1586634 RepID=A0AAV8WWX0_9CUCU|nr:hypothetical protein NQ314_016242 [Rhamnusium bicolor]
MELTVNNSHNDCLHLKMKNLIMEIDKYLMTRAEDSALLINKHLQDLSCGIQISWQIPHLPHLMQTLTKWVESQDEEIVCLSLGVLVNLCYKNLPAVYTLSKSIDIKKFLRFCLPLRGPIIEIHVCKLMVILDYMHIDIPKHTLVKFVDPTFLSIFQAFKNNDSILLRQIVDFFQDIITQSKDRQVLKDYNQYGDQIEKLLHLVESNVTSNSSNSKPSSKDNNNPECISLVLEFIHSLMLHDIVSIINLHAKISTLAIDWVNSEGVSYQALAVLTKIIEKNTEGEAEKNSSELLQSLIKALPSLLLILQSNSMPSNMESCRRLGALLQLLRAMLQANSIRTNVLHILKEETIEKVFMPLQLDNLIDCLPRLKSNDTNMSSTDAVNTYLYALGLVNELAQHDASWLALQSALMENRLIDENNTSNIATTQVMELYEYKLATLGYAEKSALNSIEAATERCTQLQHRLAQITAEQNKLQQLLFHTEHCLEQTSRSKEEFKEMYGQERNRALAATGHIKIYEGQIKNKDKELAECGNQLADCNKQIKNMSEAINKLEEQIAKKKQYVNKLIESGNKTEKKLQRTEEMLKEANVDNKNLNLQIVNLEEKLNLKEIKLAQLTEQYQATRAIIETINKVASSQMP